MGASSSLSLMTQRSKRFSGPSVASLSILFVACRVMSALGNLVCRWESFLQANVCANAGESEMKELKRQDVNFALVVADSLLARDQLDRALKLGQEKLREKQVSGLKRGRSGLLR